METQTVMQIKELESRPFKIITGQDWGKVESNNRDVLNNENYSLYFKYYYDLPQGDEHSPFNLGLYYDEKDDALKSSQYIGIMPLLSYKDEEIKENKNYIVIHPRFDALAVEMLKYVLKSDDFYENNDKIKFKDFEIKELYKYPEQFNGKENKVLFGIIKDLEPINIDSMKRGKSNFESLIDNITIFEVWNFISKARIVCQKMLKYQFEKVEENFIGKVKGKIDLQKQIKKNLSVGRIDRAYCVYNKLSIDNAENRILKYALYLCERSIGELSGIDLINEHLAYCKRALSSVKLTKCTLADFRGIKNNGIYRYYKPAIEAARKVIKRISISFVGDENEEQITFSKSVQPFFIDMNVLFELYCRALVSEVIKNTECTLVEFGKPYNILKSKLDGFIETLIPDIIIEKNNKPIAVIDAKYSSLSSNNRERTHQIMAYMLLLDCNYGGFIFPIKKEELLRDEVLEERIQSIDKFALNIGIDISNVGDGKDRIEKWISKIKNGGVKK